MHLNNINETRQSYTSTEQAIMKENKLLKSQVKELNEQIGLLQEELSHYEDGVQRLPLMSFIEYAEKYPPEQNEQARVVKEVLRDVYTSFSNEERERLKALGHKSASVMGFSANGQVMDHMHYTGTICVPPAIRTASEALQPAPIPACLDTPQAQALLQRLVQAGLLDEAWQPCGLSIAERGELAATLAERLGLTAHWQLFGQLWGDKPGTLRTGCYKAQDKSKMLDFKDALKQILN